MTLFAPIFHQLKILMLIRTKTPYRITAASLFAGFVSLFFLSSAADGQWVQISQLPPVTIHQWGAMAFRGGNLWCGRDKLYRSQDTGNSWSLQSLPFNDGGITDIDFQDKLNGAVGTKNGVYATSNGGTSWYVLKRFASSGATSSVCMLDSAGAVIFMASSEGMFRAAKQVTWGPLSFFANPCLRGSPDRARIFSMVGSNVKYNAASMYYTTDQGVNWMATLDTFPVGVVTFATDSCNSGAWYIPYTPRNSPLLLEGPPDCGLYRTLDGGTTYQVTFTAPLDFLSGNVVTSSYAVYCGTQRGVLRSTDQGTTWEERVGFPNWKWGRLLTVVSDTIIIACDTGGVVWRLDDPDVIKGVHSTAPHFSSDTVHVKLCDIATLNAVTTRQGCKLYPFDSLGFHSPDSNNVHFQIGAISQTDSTMTTTMSVTASHTGTYKIPIYYRQRQGSLFFDSTHLETVIVTADSPHYAVTPHTFDFGAQSLCIAKLVRDTFSVSFRGCGGATIDSMFLRLDSSQYTDFAFTTINNVSIDTSSKRYAISFMPTKALHEHGKIFLYFSNGDFSHIDTILVAGAGLSDTQIFIPSANTFGFGTVSTCNLLGRDTSVFFYNKGCDPDTITALNLTGVGFHWLRDSLPIIVKPGDSVSFRFHFMPLGEGAFNGEVDLRVTSMGLTQTPSILLNGAGVQGVGVLNVPFTSLSAGSFSFCSGDTTISTIISNTGCDTLHITNIKFVGDATLSYLSSTTDTLLIPNATKSFAFSFAPRTKGSHSGTLTFHSQNIHGNDPGHDTTISIAGLGTPGHKYIKASIASADLGSVYACQLRDTMLTLTNPGCDTLRVISGSLDNTAYHSDQTYPIVIPPDSSVPVRVFLSPDTTGHPTTISSTFTFLSDADTGSTISIPLTVSMIYPQHLLLSLSPQDSAGAGKAVMFKLILSGNAPGVSALHFDLTNDDNLLAFVSATGIGLTWTAGTSSSTRHFTLSPVPSAGQIGTLTFQTFLSTTSTTPITLSQPTFENDRNVPNDCIASLGDSSSSFNYIYSCSQGLMQDLMNGVPFNVDRVVPNPATDKLDVYYHCGKTTATSESAGIECKLYDFLGRMQLHQGGMESGNLISLDVSSLPTGVYSLQIQMAGATQNRRVVIAR